jgi:hypothetical protein
MTIIIPPMQAEVIGLCHHSLSAAREYARSISVEDKRLAPLFTRIAGGCSTLLSDLDRRIPRTSWEAYHKQVVSADPLSLENLKQLYIRMLPEQREMLEKVAHAILTKEFVLEEVPALTN